MSTAAAGLASDAGPGREDARGGQTLTSLDSQVVVTLGGAERLS